MPQPEINTDLSAPGIADLQRSWRLEAATILGVVLCFLAIEAARRNALPTPVPFLMLYAAVALAAGYSGRRVGIIAALVVAAFVVHSSIVGYGPKSLTGGAVQLSIGILIAFGIAILIGDRRDKLVRLAASLDQSQRELTQARDALAATAEQKTHQLEDTTSELNGVRMQLANTVEHSPAAVVVITDKYEITSINPAGLESFGLAALPSQLSQVGKFMQHIRFYSEDGSEFEFGSGPLFQALTNATITDDFVCRIVRMDKTERWLRGSFAPIRETDGRITGATAIFVDITEKIHARFQMKDLVSRVLKAHEDDRAIIARRLQDDIAQHLVATKMNLHSAALTRNYVDPVRDTIGRIDTLMDSVRDWSLELRPAALDDLGLVSALRWYLTSQQKFFDYDITFDAKIDDESISSDVSIACFRVVQQAVRNVLEHADARSLDVSLYKQDEYLCVEIVDDGRGFNVNDVMLGRSEGSGLGLITMRERVVLAGGIFKVTSAPKQGTNITVCFTAW